MLAALALAAAVTVSGPAKAVDGDTLVMGAIQMRLDGIDAPEPEQMCGGRPCGREASAWLASEIRGRALVCLPRSHDRWGRLLGRCDAGRGDIGARMVARGLAFASPRRAYDAEEDRARRARLGVWSAETYVRPASWRRARDRGTQTRPKPTVPPQRP